MKKIAFICLFVFCLIEVNATHLRAGYISYRQLSGLKYEITVRAYTYTGTDVRFGDGVLIFGDGTSFNLPVVENGTRATLLEDGEFFSEVLEINLGPEVSSAEFVITHEFPEEGHFIISYIEPNRNEDVINIPGSVNVPFSIATSLTVREDLVGQSSPSLLFEPLINASLGVKLSQSLAAVSSNDYKLRYDLVTPFANSTDRVSGYYIPDGVSLNKINGLLEWDLGDQPNVLGEYNFAVAITQYEAIEQGGFRVMGRMTVDFQVLFNETDGEIGLIEDEQLGENNAILVEEGEEARITIGVLSNGLAPEVDVSSEAGIKAAFITTQEGLDIQIDLNTTQEIVRPNPYTLSFRIKVPVADLPDLEYHYNILYYTLAGDDAITLITSIPESVRNEKFSIKPNPVTDRIVSDHFINKQIHIVNMNGIPVSGYRHDMDEVEITALSPGLYFLIVEGAKPHKFIKK